MRAHEYLFEASDVRTTLEKLRDVIDHPATEATIREVAQRKYDLLSSQIVDEEEINLPVVNRINIPVNVDEEMLDKQFIAGVTIYDIYQSLCDTLPSPSSIEFSRMGTVTIVVPPPYHGYTKLEFAQHLRANIPGVRSVTGGAQRVDKMGEMEGYIFILHYV
jgi:hypothetical protein